MPFDLSTPILAFDPNDPFPEDEPEREEVGGEVQPLSFTPELADFSAFLQDEPDSPTSAESLAGVSRGIARGIVGAQRAATVDAPETAAQLIEEVRGEGFIKKKFTRGLAMARTLVGNVIEATAPAARGQAILQAGEFPSEEEIQQALQVGEQQKQEMRAVGETMKREAIEVLNNLDAGEADNVVEWLVGNMAEQLPIMGLAMGGGFAGSLASGGSAAGAILGSAASIYPLEQALLEDELIQGGLDPETAALTSAAGAVPIAALEGVTEAVFGRAAANRLVTGRIKKAFTDRLINIGKGLAFGAVGEGLTEGGQESLSGLFVLFATGELPENMMARVGESMLVGSTVGASFGTTVTAVAEGGDAALQAFREDSHQARQRLLRAQAALYDADEAPVGDVIGNKIKVQHGENQTRWRELKEDGTLGPFAKTPTRSEIREHHTGETDAARAAAETAESTIEREPVNIPVSRAAADLAARADRDITPAAVEANIRYLSGPFEGSARRDYDNLSEREVNDRKADLEEIALGDSDADYTTRLTALARLRALDLIEAQNRATREGPLSFSRAARAIAELDDFDFQAFEDYTVADGREQELRILNEARAMRENLEAFETESQSEKVRTRVAQAAESRVSGVTEGSQVFTREGQLGEVVDVQPDGSLDVRFQDEAETQTVNPSEVQPIPQPGTTARLSDGTVLDVISLQDDKVTARPKGGQPNVYELADIDQVGDLTATRAAQEADGIEQEAAAQSEADGPFRPMPQAIEGATDRRTGEVVSLTEISDDGTKVKTDYGETIPLDDIELPSQAGPQGGVPTLAEVREQGLPIPTFKPGTTPSEGNHINFLRIPDEAVEAFEQHLKTNPDAQLNHIVESFSGRMTILPQPHKTGFTTYAVELDATNRDLSDASKRLLRRMAGRPSSNITASTLKAGFRLKGPMFAEETTVMKVPQALLTAVDHSNQDSEYLRRLADLSFTITAAEAQAYSEAQQASEAARDARIAANDIGEAEVLEVEAVEKHAELAETVIKEETKRRRAFWDAMQDDIQALMDPTNVDILEVLNNVDQQALLKVRGIGEATAPRVIEAREAGGQFESLSDLVERVKGLGEGTVQSDAFQADLISQAIEGSGNLLEVMNQRLKNFIEALPARPSGQADGFYLAFEHPDVPGLHFVLDKERIQTTVRDSEGAVQPAERDVYHIYFVTPEGKQIRSRTIGSEEPTIRVPVSQASRAQDVINRGLEEDLPLDTIEDTLMSERREVRKVETSDGELVDVIAETTDPDTGVTSLTIQDERGETFQVDADTVTNKGTSREQTFNAAVPRRLNPSEAAGSVLRSILDFRGTAKLFSVGQWRSSIPGVWGDIRQRADGSYQAVLMERPVDGVTRRHKTADLKGFQNFADRQAAETWLRELGFSPLRVEHNIPRKFEALPSLDTLDSQSVDEINNDLTQILEFYWKQGFTPPEVLDYANRFAQEWQRRDLEGRTRALFQRSSAAFRLLGLFSPEQAHRASVSGAVPTRVTSAAQPSVEIDGNEVIINRPTATERADNTSVLDGRLLLPGDSPTDLETVRRAKEILSEELHHERFVDLANLDDATLQDRIVRVGRRDRKLGIVVGYDPSDTLVSVQMWDSEGNPFIRTVKERDVKRSRSPRADADALRAARDSLSELTNIPSTPEMGQSPLDAKMGLDGITDFDQYTRGLKAYIENILKGVKISPDGQTVGDLDVVVDKLTPAWIRMAELGISNVPAERGQVSEELYQKRLREAEAQGLSELSKKDQDRVKKELRDASFFIEDEPLVPKPIDRLLDHEAHRRIVGQFSNISPYGELMARAKLGNLKDDKVRQIEDQAEEFGVDPDLPLYRKVEWLMQNIWDPNVAHHMLQLRREVGAFGFLRELKEKFPGQLIEMQIPAMGATVNTNGWLNTVTMPRTLANRHPTMRMYHFLAEKARTEYGVTAGEGREIIRALRAETGLGDVENVQLIDDLLQDETLGEAQENPRQILTRQEVLDNISDERKKSLKAIPNWYHAYRTLREFFIRGIRLNIRNNLVAGMHPTDITADLASDDPEAIDKAQRLLRTEYDVTDEEMVLLEERVENGQPFWALSRNADARYARPPSEVEAFLDLRDQYKTLEDIPSDVLSSMSEWMREEFDFWAKYGINNYAPRIMRGRHAIKLNGELIAFAPDGDTAQYFFERVARGDFSDKGITPADVDNLVLELRKPLPDDVDFRDVGHEKMARIWHSLKKQGGPEGMVTKMARAMTKELGLSSGPTAPKNLHTQARLSDLHDIIEDPFERYLIYWNRTARNTFIRDVNHALETARSVDLQISQAKGLDPAFPHQNLTRHDSDTRKYIEDLHNSYRGELTERDKNFSSAVAWLTTPARIGAVRLRQIIERGLRNPDWSLWSDPAFVEAVYNPRFTTRRWAASMTGFQSFWRLGLNIAGSLINATQHFMFTPSYLVARGADPEDAISDSIISASKDIYEYARASRKGEASDLTRFAHRVGVSVDPARGTAQPGLNIGGSTLSRPLKFESDNILARLGKDVEWVFMLPFSTAERYVRLSSAFAARRHAQRAGMHEGAQVAFAREVVDNTQFQYYDQALPPAMRGPLMRVWGQFKQFPVNAIKFEVDLVKGMVGGRYRGTRRAQGKSAREQAAKAAILFHLTGLAAGGFTWFALRPLLSPLSFLLPYLGLEGEDMEQVIANTFGDHERRALRASGNQVPGPEFMKARNLLLYGLPGLVDINVSQRLGVAGLSFNPTSLADLALGPAFGMFADAGIGLFGEEGFARTNPGATFLGLTGAAALTAMTRKGIPAQSILSAYGLTELASLTTDAPLSEWLRGTAAGRRTARALTQTFHRNISATMDVFDDPDTLLPIGDNPNGITTAPNLVVRSYPGTTNQAFEGITRGVGVQPIRASEERAYLAWEAAKVRSRAARRRTFVEQAATAQMRVEGTANGVVSEDAARILEYAHDEYGIRIDWTKEVMEEINKRLENPTTRQQRRQPVSIRSERR